ncbi:hypothetical protein H6800_03225 [Candidatus Nomurabacteria bacterium]|nr:hypothetical protein [Candidatus Nomurabacteria bacterium]
MMAAGPESAAEYTEACAEATRLIPGIEAVYTKLVEAVNSGAAIEERLDLWGSLCARMVYFDVLMDHIDELAAVITVAYAESLTNHHSMPPFAGGSSGNGAVVIAVTEVEMVAYLDGVDEDGHAYVLVPDQDGEGMVMPLEDLDPSTLVIGRRSRFSYMGT